MKTLEELKNYYDTSLSNDLNILEEERKKVANKVIPIHIFGVIGIIVSLLLFFVISFVSFFILVGLIIVWTIFYKRLTKSYVSNFKTTVIHKIIKFIDENLDYYPTQCISKTVYMSSKIFRKNPDRYKGDDFVSGKIGKTELTFSEIHSEYKTQSRSSNGTSSTQWHTIFKGIFFAANFNKKFKGETLVLPDTAQKMFGNLLGNLFQSWNKMRGQLIKMEDPEFEKLFVVYGSDQIEARYILSTSLMRRITDFKEKTKKDIYL